MISILNIKQFQNLFFFFFSKPENTNEVSIHCLLTEVSNKMSEIIMKNVFAIAQNEGLLVVPVPGDSDMIQERASRSILACLLWHCGLGKKIEFFPLKAVKSVFLSLYISTTSKKFFNRDHPYPVTILMSMDIYKIFAIIQMLQCSLYLFFDRKSIEVIE